MENIDLDMLEKYVVLAMGLGFGIIFLIYAITATRDKIENKKKWREIKNGK